MKLKTTVGSAPLRVLLLAAETAQVTVELLERSKTKNQRNKNKKGKYGNSIR
jgi:hypothetical protein